MKVHITPNISITKEKRGTTLPKQREKVLKVAQVLVQNKIIINYWISFSWRLHSEPKTRPTLKLHRLYYHYHCQGFSHLLTSIKLMIIAKEKATHNIQASERVSQCKGILYHNSQHAVSESNMNNRHSHMDYQLI